MKNSKKRKKKSIKKNKIERNKNIIVNNNITAKDKLNCYLLGVEEEIKNKELINDKLAKKKIVYKRKIIPQNDFDKSIDKIKYNNNTIIFTDFSQEISHDNGISVSVIKRANNEENLESNMTNTFMDILNTENFKNSIQDDYNC